MSRPLAVLGISFVFVLLLHAHNIPHGPCDTLRVVPCEVEGTVCEKGTAAVR